MNELAEIHGILGSNTISTWIKKNKELNRNLKPKNTSDSMKKKTTSKAEKLKEKQRKTKRQRSYEQMHISCLEQDLDKARQRVLFYGRALNIINEIALELTGLDLLKKTGEQLSTRRAKKKS